MKLRLQSLLFAFAGIGALAASPAAIARAAPLMVIAEIVAKPDSADALRPQMVTLAAHARKERGCISYRLYEDRARAGRFLTYESWSNDAALDAHLASPAMKAAGAQFGTMLAQAPVVTRLKAP